MTRDKLFILKKDFEDPAYPGARFYCWHCAAIEGVLALYPSVYASLDVERIDWMRPRRRIVDLIGEENQSAPVLVFADDAPRSLATGEHNGRLFANSVQSILDALTVRHGLPRAHP